MGIIKTATTSNPSTGSLFLGSLPAEYAKTGPVSGLKLVIEGTTTDFTPTYIMGSEKKGWTVTCKGGGSIPTGDITWALVTKSSQPVGE